jgi:hypothetical protein
MATGNTQDLTSFVIDTTGSIWYLSSAGAAIELKDGEISGYWTALSGGGIGSDSLVTINSDNAPLAVLDVYHESGNDNLALFRDSGGDSIHVFLSSSDDAVYRMQDDLGNIGIELHADDDSYIDGGRLGIKLTSPAYNLDVSTHARIYSSGGNPQFLIENNQKDWVFFMTNGNDDLKLKPNTSGGIFRVQTFGNDNVFTINPSDSSIVAMDLHSGNDTTSFSGIMVAGSDGRLLRSDSASVASFLGVATGGGGLWTDAGGNIYITQTTDKVAINQTTAGQFLDVNGAIKVVGGKETETVSNAMIFYMVDSLGVILVKGESTSARGNLAFELDTNDEDGPFRALFADGDTRVLSLIGSAGSIGSVGVNYDTPAEDLHIRYKTGTDEPRILVEGPDGGNVACGYRTGIGGGGTQGGLALESARGSKSLLSGIGNFDSYLTTMQTTGLWFGTNNTPYIEIEWDGDVFFYEGAGDTLLYIDESTESFGFGHADPVSKIHLSESGTDNQYIRFTNATTGHTSGDGIVFGLVGSDGNISNNESGDITVNINSSEVLRFNQDGYVGIGTGDNPTRILTVESADNDLLHLESTDALATIALLDNSTTNNIILQRSANNLLVCPSGGKVGFGGASAPDAAIHTQAAATTEPALIAQAISSQTGDIFQVLASNDDEHFSVESDGVANFSEDRIKFGSLLIIRGSGSPEGVESAPVGSMYLREDGSTGTTLYMKEGGGTGNTGWAANG